MILAGWIVTISTKSNACEAAPSALRELVNQKLCAAHPHIVHLREAFLTPHHLGIAMEFADSGDLLDFIDTFAAQVGSASANPQAGANPTVCSQTPKPLHPFPQCERLPLTSDYANELARLPLTVMHTIFGPRQRLTSSPLVPSHR